MRARALPFAVCSMLVALLVVGLGMRSDGRLANALVAPAAQGGSPAAASPVPQPISNVTGQLPPDIGVALLANADVSGLPVNGLVMRLRRVRLLPSDQFTERANHARSSLAPPMERSGSSPAVRLSYRIASSIR
jgi:hypothetical protein